MSDQQKENQPAVKIEKVFSPTSLPTFYANNARVAVSFHDIRVYFMEARPSPASLEESTDVPSSANLFELCAIIMSPECVQALAQGLAKATDTYQEKFGKLRPTPPGM
jgi:hypothetical protein